MNNEIEKENLNEIIKNVAKESKKINNDDIKKISENIENDFNFEKVLDEIVLASNDYRVIFVEGKEELVYDNGEFHLCSTINAKGPRRKITRKQAAEMYIEYFIRYQLNPIIEQKKLHNISQQISKVQQKNISEKSAPKIGTNKKTTDVKTKSVKKKQIEIER